MIALSPGGACAATAICHSAVDEQPIGPAPPLRSQHGQRSAERDGREDEMSGRASHHDTPIGKVEGLTRIGEDTILYGCRQTHEGSRLGGMCARTVAYLPRTTEE